MCSRVYLFLAGRCRVSGGVELYARMHACTCVCVSRGVVRLWGDILHFGRVLACLLAGWATYGGVAQRWAGTTYLGRTGGRRWNVAWLLDACAGTLGSRCNLHARGLASQTTGERCRMDGWVHRGETGVSSRW